MRTAELMEIPYEELEAARKKATDEVYGDDSWEKELDAKNRAKAGMARMPRHWKETPRG